VKIVIALMPDPSRNLETSPPLDSGGCPRCGVRLASEFKYCPNCAYRLRPKIVQTTPSPDERPTLMTRLVALGGYLAFASILLLVVYAGFSLFRQPETGPETQPRVILTRDPNGLPLNAGSFLRVDGGQAYYGYVASEEAEEQVPELFRVDDSFDLCLHEVTNDQYYEFLLDRARKSGRPVREWLFPKGWQRYTGKPDVSKIYDRRDGNLPVMEVFYQAALEFCAWYWEEKLKDPDYIVDLPTPLEYLRAARGDDYRNNFPWGRRIDEPGARARLDKGPLPVRDKEVGRYHGFFALVGNAAEWVHGYVPNRVPMAAGWSHLNALYRGLERRSPFGDDGFVLVSRGEPRPDLGFRILIRSTPALPEFCKVEPGDVHHMPAAGDRLRPPPLFDEDGNPRGEAGAVTFPTATRTVPRAFEITRSEITNRQYLYFLRAVSPQKTAAEMEQLIPSAWKRDNPWQWTRKDPEKQKEAWEDTVYLGPYGSPPGSRTGSRNVAACRRSGSSCAPGVGRAASRIPGDKARRPPSWSANAASTRRSGRSLCWAKPRRWSAWSATCPSTCGTPTGRAPIPTRRRAGGSWPAAATGSRRSSAPWTPSWTRPGSTSSSTSSSAPRSSIRSRSTPAFASSARRGCSEPCEASFP
jgi:hypothetical protein